LQIPDYCRQIETYLCQKNDGHLIRVVGPSFELVSRWAADGVPLKVAFRGIDRYFERYYRHGPRRRPVRIDFCEADVLDSFDEWRRAVGLTGSAVSDAAGTEDMSHARRGPSLAGHLQRVLLRLTNVRVNGGLGEEADTVIDRVSQELDAAREKSSGLRGEARRLLIARLAELDVELLRAARGLLQEPERMTLQREADEELSAFRQTMAPAVYARAREAAVDRLVRERLNLPVLTFN
jgi:hypothetical protein